MKNARNHHPKKLTETATGYREKERIPRRAKSREAVKMRRNAEGEDQAILPRKLKLKFLLFNGGKQRTLLQSFHFTLSLSLSLSLSLCYSVNVDI